ncbi:sulfite exporter TauE/SafE family protein [Aliiroseovarius crassostreae]|uniref:sulfite exporter TauE/SafE family protein n=1 Tax=Aliiroseovarius crassostreae TaxID=154981 RepID=UPI002204F5BE|nr:sulfite exporter TauE/SafE family protein [Aliiroseovarius crassostreae]UWP90154.1 sulfite exporter TauE/SafE family protein [Aliiroseovarius crassostreae]UWQ02806.1 sulfite exporter TauE/SafE family protein [Aliiroseovarius crassostreae]
MPDTYLLIQMALLLLIIGAGAGVLAGLLGVGGGIVLVPAFYYAFFTMGYASDQLMQLCLATSLATIVVTSLRSVLSHHKKGAVDWDVLKSWAPGIVIGAVIGVLAAAELRSSILQMIFAILALIVGGYLSFGRADWRLSDEMPKAGRRAVLSPLLGFLSVLMGIGGGSFGVPVMTLHGFPIHRAVATAAGFGLIIALPSVIGFLFVPVAIAPPLTLGAVNVPTFLLVIVMTMITTPYGVKLAHSMNPKPLKKLFGIFLILVALNMLRKALGL